MSKKRKRKQEKSKGKDVFFFIPDTAEEGFYLKLSLTKTPPKLLSEHEIEIYFSKNGVARFCDERGVFIEIWMGARRVRIGTQADIEAFIYNYYARQGADLPSDFSAQQLILSYATVCFRQAYMLKIPTR